jgi:homotetrameric cytidine deaminase
LRSLHDAADAARSNSYAPYSGFTVGAALLVEGGDVVTAGNVENASYGLTICAERACVFRAIAAGARRFEAAAIAGNQATVSPCGACRQVLAEFFPADAPIVFPFCGELVAVRLEALLPMAFRPEGLSPEP